MNDKEYKNLLFEKCGLIKSEDIFGRNSKLRKIDIDDSYPQFIFQNKEKFSDWII